MKHLEIRRHSLTKKGEERGSGSHLSSEGVRLAREAGQTMGPYGYVVASVVPRTLETAIAMGFAVDVCIDHGGGPLWDASLEEVPFHAQWEADKPFVLYRDAIARGGAMYELAQLQVDIWTSALERVPDGGSVLIVTHGGLSDSGLVHALPNENHASWGRPISQLEGGRLTYDGEDFGLGELIRLG